MNTNYCRHLRTKKMFTGATAEEAFADKTGEDRTPCHYWCNRTQSAVGVDDQMVHKQKCVEGRTCFEE